MAQRTGAPNDSSALATRLLVAPVDAQLPWPVKSLWRAAVPTTTGLAAMEEILRMAKPVPLAVRSERNLLSALAADDGQAVMEHAARPGDHQLAAAVLAALRLADHLPDRALSLLTWARSSSFDLGALRFIRRYVPNLMVMAELGPSVRLWALADNSGLGLLEAELLDRAGRPAEALAVRQGLPAPDLRLLATTLDSSRSGHGQQVLVATSHVGVGGDDVETLLGVLRARAMLEVGDPEAALDSFNDLASVPGVAPSIRVWILRGQGDALSSLGRTAEAELAVAEWQALVASVVGAEVASPDRLRAVAVESAHEGSPAPSIAAPAIEQGDGEPAQGGQAPVLGGRSLASAMEDAQARVRRQPRWSENPGMLGGRRQEDFQDEVDELIAGGHLQAAESLLLALLDCLDEAVDARRGLDPTHYVTLAGLFSQQMMPFEELATLTRLADAYRRSGQVAPSEVLHQIETVERSIVRLMEQP